MSFAWAKIGERPIDIAVICASNRDLQDLVARRLFREDRYYRINGLRVTLPPLRSAPTFWRSQTIISHTATGLGADSNCRSRRARSSCGIHRQVICASWTMS